MHRQKCAKQMKKHQQPLEQYFIVVYNRKKSPKIYSISAHNSFHPTLKTNYWLQMTDTEFAG
jgi:hypothetical protein